MWRHERYVNFSATPDGQTDEGSTGCQLSSALHRGIEATSSLSLTFIVRLKISAVRQWSRFMKSQWEQLPFYWHVSTVFMCICVGLFHINLREQVRKAKTRKVFDIVHIAWFSNWIDSYCHLNIPALAHCVTITKWFREKLSQVALQLEAHFVCMCSLFQLTFFFPRALVSSFNCPMQRQHPCRSHSFPGTPVHIYTVYTDIHAHYKYFI